VTLSPVTQGQLRLTNLRAQPSRAADAATISYVLSAAADVQVRVLAPNGRPVATLPTTRSALGLNTVVWSSRAANGRPLQRGVYLVEAIARDAEGRAVRAVTAIPLR